MSFSAEWDRRYREDTHLSIWPFSDLVSLVMRHIKPAATGFSVLELGCGAGANLPFFEKLGAEYHAVEGSGHIVDRLHRLYPHLNDRIVVGDFTREIPFRRSFDLIVDRGSLTHNATVPIEACLSAVHASLEPGGRYIGTDWFSTDHVEFGRGKPDGDDYTKTGYSRGPFADVGRVHFSDRKHLQRLFQDFELEVLEKKIISREFPAPRYVQALWNIVAKKRPGESETQDVKARRFSG